MREKITTENGLEWELGRVFEVTLEHEFIDEDKALSIACDLLDGCDAEAEMLRGGPCNSPMLTLSFGDGCSIKDVRLLVDSVSTAIFDA